MKKVWLQSWCVFIPNDSSSSAMFTVWIKMETNDLYQAAVICCWNENMSTAHCYSQAHHHGPTTEGHSGYPFGPVSCFWRYLNCSEIVFSTSSRSSERRKVCSFGWRERAAGVHVEVRARIIIRIAFLILLFTTDKSFLYDTMCPQWKCQYGKNSMNTKCLLNMANNTTGI